MALVEFLAGVGGSYIANKIDRVFAYIRHLPIPSSVAAHKRELAAKLRDMPFIYRDLELNILNDFVEVELGNVHRHSLLPTSHSSLSIRTGFEKLRDTRRLILVGAPGMGKTTLERFGVLSCIAQVQNGVRFHELERPVPFYVPLKAIDNIHPSPILRYLLSNNSYLSGGKGLRRLARLVQDRRLFLLLDGLDEIPLAGGHHLIKEELEALLGNPEAADILRTNPVEAEIYAGMRGCRVWLSSRPEFLRESGITIGQDVSVLQVLGVKNERPRLVHTIFNKYRSRAAVYEEVLDEEHFLQELLQSGDGEIEQLSSNPLFLTVMCYVYANERLSSPEASFTWAGSIFDLINRCIILLLRDIDEHKARGLPHAQRLALLGRRSGFPDEKLAFLRWFAALLYKNKQSLFSREDVKEAALEFFEHHHTQHPAGLIAKGIRSEHSNDFVTQLVYSGVFVTVDAAGGNRLYDFPHRRFREVLASDFLSTPEGVQFICAHVDERHLTELLFVMVERTPYARHIVQAVADKIIEVQDGTYLGQVLHGCLIRSNDKPAARHTVHRLLETLIRSDSQLALPRGVLDFVGSEVLFAQWVADELQRAIAARSSRRTYMLGMILQRAEPARFSRITSLYWAGQTWDKEFAPVMIALALIADASHALSVVLPKLQPIRPEDEPQDRRFSDLCFIVLSVAPFGSKTETALQLQELLAPTERPAFTKWLRRSDLALFNQIAKQFPPVVRPESGGHGSPHLPTVFT